MEPDDLEELGLDAEEVEGTLGGFNPEYDERKEWDENEDFDDGDE